MKKLAISRKEILIGSAMLVTLGWGAWVTKELVKPEAEVVRVNVAGLVQEFMMTVSHSNWNPDEISKQTEAYTKSLDALIDRESKAGNTVLITEAVLSKGTRDITPQIRAELSQSMSLPLSANPRATGTPISNYATVAKAAAEGKQ